MLLDEPAGSLIGFYPGENEEMEIRQRKLLADVKGVREIQNGILDVVNQWDNLPKSLKQLVHISGRNAYIDYFSSVKQRISHALGRYVG